MHKPQTVIDAVTQAMCSLGNAGRGATSGALDAARTIHGCRAKLARLLGCPRADHVCFTPNSTAALNTAIDTLDNAIASQDSSLDMLAQATYTRDAILNAMADVRKYADALEVIVAKKFWPMPSYQDILMYV